MFAELGHICLVVAFVFAAIQTCAVFLPVIGRETWADDIAQKFTIRASLIVCGAMLASFGCLVAAFIGSDFSVALVVQHSHAAKPLLYKITGTWGNHEGSMLLFVLIHTGFAAAYALLSGKSQAGFRVKVLAICGGLTVLFAGFTLFTSNPFWRVFPSPLSGLGLNPVLQDIGLAIHPPTLYVGYVGLSIPFAMSIAGLWQGRIDGGWARAMLPWASFAWAFLTLGIMLGSIWAYYELGWGGWWAWDPVENVSFMPWLAAIALIHSLRVVARHGGLAAWTVLLAIFSFSLSLIGTFVVRSGVLLSVHAFAVDPTRGAYILGILALVVGGALALYGHRSTTLFVPERFEPKSHEAALLFNNLMMSLLLLIVALGTFYPLLLDALGGDTVTVGPPYFNAFFMPLGAVLALVMAIGPYLGWQNSTARLPSKLALTSVIGSVLIGGVGFWLTGSVWGSVGFAVSAFLAVMTIAKPFEKGMNKRAIIALARRPALTLAHLGMAVFIFGVTAMGLGSQDVTARVNLDERFELGKYDVTLTDISEIRGPNYIANRATLSVSQGSWDAMLKPELRYFPVADEVTREADLYVAPNVTIFSVMGEGDTERGWQIRLYIHPFVSWIWGGVFLMALGGLASVVQNSRVRRPEIS